MIKTYCGLNIELDMVSDLAETNDYWMAVMKFLGDIDGKEGNQLTSKQHNWLQKIANEHEAKHEKFCRN